jgi:hypothetical protein
MSNNEVRVAEPQESYKGSSYLLANTTGEGEKNYWIDKNISTPTISW